MKCFRKRHKLAWIAGISIAEILTGMLLSPLGWEKGLWAIFIGHIIGGAVMLGAGIMGARSRCSAMETVSFSFGKEGARFFAGINVIQLIGWTAVMIVSAAAAAEIIVPLGMALWDLIIGALIALWIIMGMTTLGRVNVLVMTALFLLTAVLSGTIFGADTAAAPSGTITFGTSCRHAAFLAPGHFGLYTRSGKTGESNRRQLPDLLCRQLLDVCHRYGRGPFYG